LGDKIQSSSWLLEKYLNVDFSKKSIFPENYEYTDEYHKKKFINPYHPNKTK